MDAAEPSALRPVGRRRLYEQVVDRLLRHITQADLRPGERLPPERELAERLGVSRTSVRQALVVLEVQGVVGVRHGDGAYLRRTGVLERRQRLPEVLEARDALEVKLAELAATRRTDDDVRAMRTALDRMKADIDAGGLGVDADAEFHRAVTMAAHNAVLADLMEHLAAPIAETRMESLSQPERPRKSLENHRRIARAIEDGDPTRAARAMRAHIKVVADVQLLRWQAPEDA